MKINTRTLAYLTALEITILWLSGASSQRLATVALGSLLLVLKHNRTLKLHAADNRTACQEINRAFTGPKGPLPCSLETAIPPYLEPDESSTHPFRSRDSSVV